MRASIILGITAALAGVAFVAGRGAGTRTVTVDVAAETRDRTAAASTPASAVGRGEAARKDHAAEMSVLRTLTAAEVAGTTVEPAPTEETHAATQARRQETRERLARELGNISEELTAQLVDFNDRAIAFQRRLTGDFEQGQISHEEYMNRFHEEMLVQLDELRLLVSSDQYRILTGLQPGVDPYDYMVSGVGGANPEAAGEVEPLTDEEARPDKRTAGGAL